MKSQKNDVAAGQEVNLAYYQIVSVFKEKVKVTKFQNRRNKNEDID